MGRKPLTLALLLLVLSECGRAPASQARISGADWPPDPSAHFYIKIVVPEQHDTKMVREPPCFAISLAECGK